RWRLRERGTEARGRPAGTSCSGALLIWIPGVGRANGSRMRLHVPAPGTCPGPDTTRYTRVGVDAWVMPALPAEIPTADDRDLARAATACTVGYPAHAIHGAGVPVHYHGPCAMTLP